MPDGGEIPFAEAADEYVQGKRALIGGVRSNIPKVRDVIPPTSFHEAVNVMLQYIGEDPNRAGLAETSERVRRAWDEMLSGYKIDIKSLFKLFEESNCDEMIIVKDIAFTSFCEHHLLPFIGVAHVAYIPRKQIVGLSKLARVVEAFSKRLQVQERLTTQISSALNEHIPNIVGSACKIEATHYCMCARGVKQPNAKMVTSSLLGAFRNDDKARAEFFSCVASS